MFSLVKLLANSNDSDLHDFFINQYSPRLSPSKTGWRTARGSLILIIRADSIPSNIVFPLTNYKLLV